MTDADDPETLKYVGPATAAVIESAGFTAADIRERTVSFRMLREAGTNPGVAARIRREHSLPWAFENESHTDLKRRSDQIRGLEAEERAWVAASSGDWEATDTDDQTDGWESGVTEPTEADGSGDPVAAESAWQRRSSPTDVDELDGVDKTLAGKLASAGVVSVRSLAVADPTELADALELDPELVAELTDTAAARSR